MRSDISVKLDYLSARLTPRFTTEDLMRYASEPLVELDNGTVVGINLQHDQFRGLVITGGMEVASFYRGGELVGWELVKKYNLPVTRIDICVDYPAANQDEAVAEYQKHKAALTAFFDTKEYSVKRMHWDGAHEAENGAEGSTFFSRSGDKQLRVYHKLPVVNRANGGHILRVEWQTRGKVAQALYQHIIASEQTWELALLEAWQSLNMKFLDSDFFGVDENIELGVVELPKKEKHNSAGYEHWLMGTVAPSIYKFFKDTGKNMAEELVLEIDRLILARGEIGGRVPPTPMERKAKNLAIRRENERQRLILQRELAVEPQGFYLQPLDDNGTPQGIIPRFLEPEDEGE